MSKRVKAKKRIAIFIGWQAENLPLFNVEIAPGLWSTLAIDSVKSYGWELPDYLDFQTWTKTKGV